jgi:hypothetical protein
LTPTFALAALTTLLGSSTVNPILPRYLLALAIFAAVGTAYSSIYWLKRLYPRPPR